MTAVIVTGLIQGMLYSLLGVSFVLIFKQSGVLNFAQGTIATLAVYVSFQVISNHQSYWVAAAAGIATGAAFSALIELLVVRRLSGQHHIQVAIAMLGVSLATTGVIVKVWGSTPLALTAPFSKSTVITLGGVSIDRNSLAVVATVAVIFGGLFLVVERTNFGLAMRAANEGPVTSGLMGIDVGRIQTVVWTVSGALCAVAGLLIVPSLYVDPHVLTGFFIASLAVVVLGGLGSIGGVLVAGVVFGALMSVFSYQLTARLTQTVSLVVILVVLAFFPNGIFGRSYPRMPEPPRIRTSRVRRDGGSARLRALLTRFARNDDPRRDQTKSPWSVGTVLVVGLLAVTLPWLASESTVVAMTLALGYGLAVLGQNVLFGYSGLITVGQSGFMALGAYTFAILTSERHAWSVGAALVATLGATVAVAALLSFCVGRLSGIYLALATIAFALSVPEVFAYFRDVSGGAAGISVPSIGPIGSASGNLATSYWAALLLSVLLGGGLYWVQRRPTGQAWYALRDSPRGASSLGINVTSRKILANIVAAVLAAAGGMVVTANVGYLAPTSFTIWTSIYVLAALVIGGTGSVFGSLVGAAILFAVPQIFSEYAGTLDIAFGVLLVVVLLVRPQGLFSIGVRGPLRRRPSVSDASAEPVQARELVR